MTAGRPVTIFYNDSESHVTALTCVILEQDPLFIRVRSTRTGEISRLPLQRIVRITEVSGE